MLTVARLRKQPRHFASFTGLSVEHFDTLLAALTPLYTAQERARQSRPTRQRAVGGGHPFTLELPERLLSTRRTWMTRSPRWRTGPPRTLEARVNLGQAQAHLTVKGPFLHGVKKRAG